MPTCRLTTPGQPEELLDADSASVEEIHTVLRGTAYVMGRPREVVVRRVPRDVIVAALAEPVPVEGPAS